MTFTWVIVVVLVLIVLWIIFAYNRLIRLVQRAKEAWADIDVQLKRRYDLIPNLVETVKGYATHEKSAFENVTAARSAAMGATGAAAKGQAENMLSGALKSLFAVAEAYPDLKANQNFLDLQRQLADTEDQISFARQYYNDAVATLNKLTRTIPWMFFTGVAGVHSRDFYQAPEGQDQAPQVHF